MEIKHMSCRSAVQSIQFVARNLRHVAGEQVSTWAIEKRNRSDQRKGRDNTTNRDIGWRFRASHYWPYTTTIDSVVNELLSRPIDCVCHRGRDTRLKAPCDVGNGGKPQPG
ncbi:hypothetical protein ACFE04_018162 [Oxalis oulophora]